MKSTELGTRKRRFFDGDDVSEVKRSKHQDWKLTYGHGTAWLRGAMIGKGSSASVFVANLKKNRASYSLYPPVMAVKSTEVSVSGSIQKEKLVFDNIRGCPNVINCFGEETTKGGDNGQMVYNLLLEYASGGTLADVINNSKGKGLPELVVKRYARSILRGLSHIHKQGYVHCDMKPENILLVSCYQKVDFVAKIGDLGLAKKVNQNRVKSHWRGTPMYLSPEAVTNGVQEQPADIWAFGCIVFHMLTGKPLWYSDQDLSVDEILSRIGNEDDQPWISSSISAEAMSFLKVCLSRKTFCRLPANMLLQHSFLKGLIKEIEESHDAFDINAITSSSSF